eukprot:434767-Pyramimonas_sp.AAC.1
MWLTTLSTALMSVYCWSMEMVLLISFSCSSNDSCASTCRSKAMPSQQSSQRPSQRQDSRFSAPLSVTTPHHSRSQRDTTLGHYLAVGTPLGHYSAPLSVTMRHHS